MINFNELVADLEVKTDVISMLESRLNDATQRLFQADVRNLGLERRIARLQNDLTEVTASHDKLIEARDVTSAPAPNDGEVTIKTQSELTE